MTCVKFYGLKNCDRCRAFNRWLVERDIEATLHDLRRDGLTREKLDVWVQAFGLEGLINRRGTTWRGLDEEEKSTLEAGGEEALSFLLDYPQIIKRPVIEVNGHPFAVGFTSDIETKLVSALDLDPCLLYTSPSPRDLSTSRMPSSA